MTAREVIEAAYADDAVRGGRVDDVANAILAALAVAGYQIVPLAPTKAMLVAGETAVVDTVDQYYDSEGHCCHVGTDMEVAESAYRTMLAAAKQETV